MAKLKTAEDWPVRDASPCPRCGPWCRHARTRPTAAIDLPDQPTRGHLFTGVVADVGRRGGRRGGRGGLSMPPPRVDRGAGMLRATRPAGRRSPERPELVLRYSDLLALPRQGPGQLCSRWAASGKLRGALRRRFATVTKTRHITIVTIAVYLSAIRLCTYIYTLSVRVSPSGNPMEL